MNKSCLGCKYNKCLGEPCNSCFEYSLFEPSHKDAEWWYTEAKKIE